jgi:hypothetical protein
MGLYLLIGEGGVELGVLGNVQSGLNVWIDRDAIVIATSAIAESKSESGIVILLPGSILLNVFLGHE